MLRTLRRGLGLGSCRETRRHFSSAVDTHFEAQPTAIIAIGANTGERLKTIRAALGHFEELGIKILRYSRLYESAAAYVEDQPKFLNASLAVQTRHSAHELLRILKSLEAAAGRDFQGQRYGPRPLDLDIIAFGSSLGDHILDDVLEVPHPRWKERDFVIAPLTDLYSQGEVSHMKHWTVGNGILAEAHKLWEKAGGERQLGDPELRCVLPIGLKQQMLPWQARTLVMGIVNLTPDSFSDGGCFGDTVDASLQKVRGMIEDGADIIDIGGQSTRPGAKHIDAKTELRRIMPLIRAIRNDHDIQGVTLSVDTFHSSVAREAVLAGADMINDVSAGRLDPDMHAVVGELGVTYVMMHMRGVPRNMQSAENTTYAPGRTAISVAEELQENVNKAVSAGIEPWRLILDPGIGFAKSAHGNCELLRDLKTFSLTMKGCLQKQPVLAASSRKGFLGSLTGVAQPEERDLASAVAAALSLARGASIIRMHNVAAGVQAARIADGILKDIMV